MRAIRMRSLAAYLLIAIFTLSCTSEEKDQDLADVQAQLNICYVQMQAGNYQQARNAAEVVVNTARLASVDDVAVDRARFCYTTANTLYQVNELTTALSKLLTSVVGLIGGEGFSFGSPQEVVTLMADYQAGRLDPQAASIISTVIGGFITPIKKTLEENQEQLEFIIKKGRYTWYAEHVPVKIAGSEILDAGGKTDMGEIYVLYGITRAVLGLLYLGDSQDYNFAIGPLLEYVGVENNPLLQFADGPDKLGIALTNAVAVLMGTSPNFLKLDSQIGAEMMKKSGEGLAAGFEGLLKGIKHMKEKRKGDQSLYVIEHRRETVTSSEEDILVLNWEWNQGANPLPIVDLGGFTGLVIPLSEDILTSLGKLRDDFAGVDGVDTSLQEDIFPIVALVTVVLLNSGVFDAVLEFALGNVDEAQRAQIDQVLDLVKENRDLVTGALVALVPVGMLFDFGAAFKAPKGIRELFPAWVQPPAGSDITMYTNATIVYSYECKDGGDPLRNGTFLCSKGPDDKPAVLDTEHFQKEGSDLPYILVRYAESDEEYANPLTFNSLLTWQNYPGTDNFGPAWNAELTSAGGRMAIDGFSSAFPYIGFKDPTFGGILYLDVDPINMKNPPADGGFQPATQITLNAAIASIVTAVQGFL